MTLQASGAISLSNVNTEMGVSATATRSLNDSTTRTLFGVPSGAISLSNGYGKSNRMAINVTVTSQNNYVANTAKVAGYVAGLTDVTFTVSGVIGSSSTGLVAFDVDTSWAAGDTVTVVNNSYILGMGGQGGAGAAHWPGISNGTNGAAGGPALRAQRPVTVVNASGVIGGGGGGGGGGGAEAYFNAGQGAGGGGGGAGYLGGGGGLGGWVSGGAVRATAGDAGSNTTPGDGGGETSAGAASGGGGGSLGANGTSGANYGTATLPAGSFGGGGNCTMAGSDAQITWSSFGQRYGTVG